MRDRSSLIARTGLAEVKTWVNFVEEAEIESLVEAAGLREGAPFSTSLPQQAFTAQRWPKAS
jgi:hypothetical protein